MAETALSSIKVVELGGVISVPYCTKLMADMGAEVIKIEVPGNGGPSRSHGPFPGDDPNPERSLLFAYMNTNKLGITLDVKSVLGKKIFKELLREADILVEGNQPKLMDELGLDYETLSGINPNLIVTSITPFGQTGPYRDYKATDLISFQIGGVAYGTPGEVEEPDDHPPLKGPGHQGDIMAGITGASASMCALMGRKLTGRGQHVDVSEQETLIRAMGGAIVSYVSRGEIPNRVAGIGRSVGTRKPLLAKDGYFSLQLIFDNFWESFKNLMGRPEWMDSEKFNERQSRIDNMETVLLFVEEWSKNYTREELYQILQVENHLPFLPVNSMEDLFTHPHVIERGMLVEMDHPQIGKFQAPGPPYDFSGTPWRIASPAPTLGQHNNEIICDRLGYSREDLVKMRQRSVI
ncbi:CoA transferase [SAR202 cluster bacterium AC-647-N09_OGT_505m]|nr:CoA transferase [SAR202 cluster bacterium AC-647-N09_OGT_505m]